VRLPFAPRPIEGEGLSSWTARLAAHNFVDPTAFWSWLDVGGIDDVAPSVKTIGRLAEATGLAITEIAALATRGGSLRPGWSLNAHDHGLRGAACPSCCRDAADAGRDHWWPAESQAVMWVSCLVH
jgi:hypothetical protein